MPRRIIFRPGCECCFCGPGSTLALAATDENLVRHNLDAAEEALAITRRVELIAAWELQEREKASAAKNLAPSLQSRRRKGEKKGQHIAAWELQEREKASASAVKNLTAPSRTSRLCHKGRGDITAAKNLAPLSRQARRGNCKSRRRLLLPQMRHPLLPKPAPKSERVLAGGQTRRRV